MTLADIPFQTLITWYTDQVTTNVYEYMALEATRYGYTTAKEHPLTHHHMRREIKERFRLQGWLPTGRPPTAEDYRRIRESLRQLRLNDDEIQ